MNLTQNQIETLKGKCPECNGDGYHFEVINGARVTNNLDCPRCQGTGQATIEIEKEYIDCIGCLGVGYFKTHNGVVDCRGCNGKGKIQKYKVGEEIYYDPYFKVILTKYQFEDLDKIDDLIKLKIISETKDKWRVRLA